MGTPDLYGKSLAMLGLMKLCQKWTTSSYVLARLTEYAFVLSVYFHLRATLH